MPDWWNIWLTPIIFKIPNLDEKGMRGCTSSCSWNKQVVGVRFTAQVFVIHLKHNPNLSNTFLLNATKQIFHKWVVFYPFQRDKQAKASFRLYVTNKQCLITRMCPKHCSLKSTNKQPFSTKNYVALGSLSHMGIRRSKIQCHYKHPEKRLIFSLCLFHINIFNNYKKS